MLFLAFAAFIRRIFASILFVLGAFDPSILPDPQLLLPGPPPGCPTSKYHSIMISKQKLIIIINLPGIRAGRAGSTGNTLRRFFGSFARACVCE
jgi:hypothetical protein